MLSRPRAVVVGGIGKVPSGGLALYYVHHLLGLAELGYDVHYVERQNRSLETYDPVADEMTDRPDHAVRYLAAVADRYGFGDRWSFVDRVGACHGAGWRRTREAIRTADFLLTVADPTWFEDLGECDRRLYIDGDPMFTQLDLLRGAGTRADAPRHYDTHFSYAVRIGCDDCRVPGAGVTWLPARPVVATRWWTPEPSPPDAPVVALLHWAAGGVARHDGREYGHKDRQFAEIAELPRRRPGHYVLAAGGGAVPREALTRSGWTLRSAMGASATPEAFTRTVAGARADLGVAKHAYVASRSGWFSDRSTCYLAAGRPVLHEDTGYADWLDVDAGVLAFHDLESLVDAVDRLDADYARHAAAARRVAEEHFEARTVLAGMLAAAGIG